MGKFKNYLLLTLVFFAGVLASSIVTTILAHGGDTNFIHGCIRPLGLLRIIGANDNCAQNETALDWNKGSIFSTYPVCPNCDLTSQTLIGLDLSRAYFIDANLNGLNLSGATLINANLERALLSNANLSNSNLSNASAGGVDFSNSNMTNVNLYGASVSANFESAILVGANFNNTSAGEANFSSADFSGATMQSVYLNQSNLSNANLTNTNLTDVFMSQVNLMNVEWNSSNLTNVDLTHADLTGSLNFDTTTRTGVVYFNTICPDGTNSDDNGGTCEGHLTP